MRAKEREANEIRRIAQAAITPQHVEVCGVFEVNTPIVGGGVFAPFDVFFERRAVSQHGLAPKMLFVLNDRHLWIWELKLRRAKWELGELLKKLEREGLVVVSTRPKSIWGGRLALRLIPSNSPAFEVRAIGQGPAERAFVDFCLEKGLGSN